MTRNWLVLLLASTFAAMLGAQAPVKAPPSLDLEQKQQFQLLLKDAEIAQLRQQLLKAQFDEATALFNATRDKLAALVQQAQVEGFAFDLATQTYSPVLKDKDGQPLKVDAPK
jgi:hypothetical protein